MNMREKETAGIVRCGREITPQELKGAKETVKRCSGLSCGMNISTDITIWDTASRLGACCVISLFQAADCWAVHWWPGLLKRSRLAMSGLDGINRIVGRTCRG